MPFFLVPRFEKFVSTLIVEAETAEAAWEQVHEIGDGGSELKCEYHSTPDDQPTVDEVESLTIDQAIAKLRHYSQKSPDSLPLVMLLDELEKRR